MQFPPQIERLFLRFAPAWLDLALIKKVISFGLIGCVNASIRVCPFLTGIVASFGESRMETKTTPDVFSWIHSLYANRNRMASFRPKLSEIPASIIYSGGSVGSVVFGVI